jgi:hypothetical protein
VIPYLPPIALCYVVSPLLFVSVGWVTGWLAAMVLGIASGLTQSVGWIWLRYLRETPREWW